jgi:DNA replication protein DnaC
MIKTEFDEPEPKQILCAGCGKAMTVKAFWTGRIWVYPSCHDWCSEKAYDLNVIRKRKVPARFTAFDEIMFRDPEALSAARAFNPDSALKTLAIIGMPASGKSRLMWYVMGRFFDLVQKRTKKERWVHYWIFPDLITELDRSEIAKVKTAEFCFIDDIGSTESYGRERAQLQDVIRARVQKGQWTFLTIDDASFDPGFKDLFRERAVEIYVE